MPSEKPLKVVVRGIPHEVTEQEVKDDLESLNYKVQKVTRMKGRNGPFPVIVVNTGREYMFIFSSSTAVDSSFRWSHEIEEQMSFTAVGVIIKIIIM